MIYVEYEEARNKYREAQNQYDDILSEKERLFERTQPQAIVYDKEKVSGGATSNPFDDYIIAKERKQIDERLSEIRSILEDRWRLLTIKERELRASQEWNDKIFTLYFLDGKTITDIEHLVPYSRVQIWRKLNVIKDTINGL